MSATARAGRAPPHLLTALASIGAQVYKSLEAGYKMDLESLNENLPEIKAELVFTQKRLQLRPPLEDLRSHHYKEMKRFLSIPNQFQGFGNERIFKRMSSRNGASLIQVYVHAPARFRRFALLASVAVA